MNITQPHILILLLILCAGVFFSCSQNQPIEPEPPEPNPTPNDTTTTVPTDTTRNDTVDLTGYEPEPTQYGPCAVPSCNIGPLDMTMPWIITRDSCRTNPLPNCGSRPTTRADNATHSLVGINPDNPEELLFLRYDHPDPLTSIGNYVLTNMRTNKDRYYPNMSTVTWGLLGMASQELLIVQEGNNTSNREGLWVLKFNGDSIAKLNTRLLNRPDEEEARKKDAGGSISPDGKLLCFRAEGIGYIIMNIFSGEVVDSLPELNIENRGVRYLPWSTDGRRLYFYRVLPRETFYWDRDTRELITMTGPPSANASGCYGAGYGPNTTIWGKTTDDGKDEFVIWNDQTQTETPIRTSYPAEGPAQSITFPLKFPGFCMMFVDYVEDKRDKCFWYYDKRPHFFSPDGQCELIADFD